MVRKEKARRRSGGTGLIDSCDGVDAEAEGLYMPIGDPVAGIAAVAGRDS